MDHIEVPRNSDAAADVFVSYATADYEKVRSVAEVLASVGVRLWFAKPGFQQTINGGEHFPSAIARGIKQSRVVALMCSDAALRSPNVNQEILLAWKYQRPYLPLLLERVSYPEQSEYFLEGWQWIEVLDRPAAGWLPEVQSGLARLERKTRDRPATSTGPAPPQERIDLRELRALASFTDRIWPVAAGLPAARTVRPAAFRGLGAPQTARRNAHPMGSRLSLAIDSDRAGHLLLLDEGPEGIVYCLCPSWFAPSTRIEKGLSYLPQASGVYDAFEVSGAPGREQLLAIVSDEPLAPEWLPVGEETPARVLNHHDLTDLLQRLRVLAPARWAAFATYFDVVPPVAYRDALQESRRT